jgi:drug/metabolite transporter (DMT)-like permease
LFKILGHEPARGALLALLSAALFGISPALAKVIIGDMSPTLLAGLLYAGSGIGLFVILRRQRINFIGELRAMHPSHRWKLAASIISGGILAPLFLTYGIKWGLALEVSLLLNLETVTTTIFAWLFFREYVGQRVWLSKLLILVGAVLMTVVPGNTFAFSLPGLLIVGACIFWGLDNNLTRDIDDISPMTLACVKGLSAGTFLIVVAFALGIGVVTPIQVVSSLTIGAFSFGLSLVLFILALREIGASRTSTYFAAGPFFGMIFAVTILQENPSMIQCLSSLFMALGIFILHRERHEHMHTHEELEHRHFHRSDEHHQHSHDGTEGPEPHTHTHKHVALTHSHVHWPDIHHRHE